MTYDATLAELTSLEEMMRQYMEDNFISDEVVAKLWQVYSEFNASIPMTRRGYSVFVPRFR